MSSKPSIHLSDEGKKKIQDILGRAAKDIKFREQLLQDPHKLAEVHELSSDEKTLLFSMRRVALEEVGLDVREARAFLRDNGSPATLVGKQKP